MIGVFCNPDERAVVEEFFQLFKTPWQFFRAGDAYDVVVTTGAVDCGSPFLIVFSSKSLPSDKALQIRSSALSENRMIDRDSVSLPIYGDLISLAAPDGRPICSSPSGAAVGLEIQLPSQTILRLGYNLFAEVHSLLTKGQPVEHAGTPTLERHIAMLRQWILRAGAPLVELPPVPSGRAAFACLTHDIDFIGIRQHKLDHTMWGFLFRSTVGSLKSLIRGKTSLRRVFSAWFAACSLPFVYLGWIKDFWEPFEWYLRVEKGLSPTYFLIPFKNRAGQKVNAAHAERRATKYDVNDLREIAQKLLSEGCELGVHGIDSWHDPVKGREELQRISNITGHSRIGIRMHWLLQDEKTTAVLKNAGYFYDSTAGYNETVGYRSGTSQVFRPPGAQALLELPMHIQDGALFYPQRLNLTEAQAWQRCMGIVGAIRSAGGVITLLWHDRSHGPERFWGEFYERLVQHLRASNVCFATAGQVVAWFDRRRSVAFAQSGGILTASFESDEIVAPLTVRFHLPGRSEHVDVPWCGQTDFNLQDYLQAPLAAASPLAPA